MSRRVRPGTSRKPPKEARRLPVKGKGQDEGRFFRCWNCGFVCDAERDYIGGPSDKAKISVQEQLITATSPEPGDARSAYIDLGFPLDTAPVFALCLAMSASDGTPQATEHVMQTEVAAGCPMCGSPNWQGNYS